MNYRWNLVFNMQHGAFRNLPSSSVLIPHLLTHRDSCKVSETQDETADGNLHNKACVSTRTSQKLTMISHNYHISWIPQREEPFLNLVSPQLYDKGPTHGAS